MDDNIQVLLTLAKENPELRIVPIVKADAMVDDYEYGWGLADWGEVKIDELFINENDETCYRKSEDLESLIEHMVDKHEITNNEAQIIIEKLDWEKVITVSICAL